MSTLDPAGPSAAAIARLWWVMLAVCTPVLVLVMALVLLSLRSTAPLRRLSGRAYIVLGGLMLPAVVLAGLLAFALLTGERLLARPAEPGVHRMQAVARQWEWRFGPLGGPLAADRLMIPAGRPVHVHVTSEDVIHSFWVPRLAGKIDAIPGHVNVVRIEADRPGVYRGICAEYCGTGHAAMPFVVEAVPDETKDGAATDR